MAEDSDQVADGLNTDIADGGTGFLAEENGFDRYVLWRLASWGVAAVCAVTLAVFASQWSAGWRRDYLASADVARQSQQVKSIVVDSQIEARRLSSAVDTLNADRDRLYTRVTLLEQGLDSVTGSISRQIRGPDISQAPSTIEAPPAQNPNVPQASSKPSDKPPPGASASQPDTNLQVASPVQTTAPAMASASAPKSAASSEPIAAKPAEPMPPVQPLAADVIASIPAPGSGTNSPAATSPAAVVAVQRTDFAVDLGGAGSLDGLRGLWQSLTKSNKVLTPLRPIVVVKENTTGLGMQLRLVAGPLGDAAAAAKICAALSENGRHCETTVFDGQRLAMRDDPPPAARPVRRRIGIKKPQPQASPLSFLGR
jgi:hypothetical protein